MSSSETDTRSMLKESLFKSLKVRRNLVKNNFDWNHTSHESVTDYQLDPELRQKFPLEVLRFESYECPQGSFTVV